MKRKIANIEEEETKLSHLLFKKTKNLIEKLVPETDNNEPNRKPIWDDEDDEHIRTAVPNNTSYTERLKQKYENLMGTPSWAKLDVKTDKPDEDEVLRTVGHLRQPKSHNLKKDVLEIKKLPKINAETGNEGPIISCIEFHPKASVALVTGKSGVVSLFSLGGDVINKLHSFKLEKWKSTAAHFSPDGSQAFIATNINHSYCVYNLVKAEPKLVQLPKVVKRPVIFEVSSNGQYIATTSGFDEVSIISATSRELLRSIKLNNTVKSVCFSSGNERLYCYSEQGDITIWDLKTYRPLKKFYDNGCVTASCLTISSCGRLLATGSGEGIVNIYETDKICNSEPLPQKTISNLRTKITNLRFNASTEILAASSAMYPEAVKLIHIPSYHVYTNFPIQTTHVYNVQTVNFTPNSGYMALGNNKGCAFLYRLKHFKNY